MKVFITTVAVFCFAGAHLWTPIFAGDCSKVDSGVDYSAGYNDITYQDGLSLGACCDLCNSNSACKAYVWVKDTGRCYLKSANTDLSYNAAVISGQRGPLVLESNQCSAVTSGFDIDPGNDIGQQNSSTLAGCCQYCNLNPSCKAFIWVKNTGKCYLKAVTSPTAPHPDVISGQRGGGEASACANVNDGYDITPTLNDITNQPGHTLGSCCNFCKQTTGCKSFVWRKSDGHCFLKSVSGPYNNQVGVIFGWSGGA